MSSLPLSMDEFCELAKRVVDEMPAEFKPWLKNVVVDVRNRPTRAQLRSVGLDPEEDDLLGLFDGVPITDEDHDFPHPNRVWIFKEPIEAYARSVEEAEYEIRRTIIHELAHHFGWSEEDLDAFESQPSPFDDPDEEAADE